MGPLQELDVQIGLLREPGIERGIGIGWLLSLLILMRRRSVSGEGRLVDAQKAFLFSLSE
jgi:hypothetical protein